MRKSEPLETRQLVRGIEDGTLLGHGVHDAVLGLELKSELKSKLCPEGAPTYLVSDATVADGRHGCRKVFGHLLRSIKVTLSTSHSHHFSSITTDQSTHFTMASQGPPQGPPGNPFNIRPGQQPTPDQIAAMQRQLAIDAQKNGMTVPEFVAKLKQQQMAAMQQAQAQQQAAQQGGQPQQQGQPQQGAPQPITPGPPKPEALAVAKFLKSQDLKPRTCILNGQRKDMFKGRKTPKL